MDAIDDIDIIEVTDDAVGYEPDSIGKFAVQSDGECRSLHDSLGSAIDAVADLIGADTVRAVRARMARDDVKFNVARRALAAEAAVRPAREFVNAEDLDWSRTWGHRLLFNHPSGKRKGFAARVIPPAPGSRRRPWRLRIIVDGDTAPRTVDGRVWEILPNPARLTGPARFGAHGPRKRDYTALPEGLATESMLRKQHRKQPAKGQRAAGTWCGKWHNSPVYWVDDATSLPPLSGKAAATWTANRTCGTCGKTSPEPFRHDERVGYRSCGDCRVELSRLLWRQRRDQENAAAIAWAADLVADPATVIATLDNGRDREHPWLRYLTVETFAVPTVVFGGFIDLVPDSPQDELVRQSSALLDQLDTCLNERRLVFATSDDLLWLEHQRNLAIRCGCHSKVRNAKPLLDSQDVLKPRYDWWWDLSDAVHWTESVETAQLPYVTPPPLGDAASLTGQQIRAILGNMAAGRIPCGSTVEEVAV